MIGRISEVNKTENTVKNDNSASNETKNEEKKEISNDSGEKKETESDIPDDAGEKKKTEEDTPDDSGKKENKKADIPDDSGHKKENEADKSNDVREKTTAKQNKEDGCRREKEVQKELNNKYPESKGYEILRERELCDKDGNPVVDKETGTKRRIDFVVIKDGKVVDMIEVTSKTAAKREQLAKEYRIRTAGGNYVKDSQGNIYRIPDNVETRVERRD